MYTQAPAPAAPLPPIVHTYRSQKDYQRDAALLAQSGYRVASVTSQQPRSGCLRMLLLGFFALVWKPKPLIIVTYEAAQAAAA